jgi:hypothetical protein
MFFRFLLLAELILVMFRQTSLIDLLDWSSKLAGRCFRLCQTRLSIFGGKFDWLIFVLVRYLVIGRSSFSSRLAGGIVETTQTGCAN